MRQDEWGPWVEHDKMGCPVSNGEIVELDYFDPKNGGRFISDAVKIGVDYMKEDWNEADRLCRVHGHFNWGILYYRIRKPRGMTVLEGILREVEKEDA